MSSEFEGITIRVTLSSARPGESEHRGMTVEGANEVLRSALQAQLTARYPGAAVTVETEGDRPTAIVEGAAQRMGQAIRYDVEKAALALKWAFSTLGPGLPGMGR